jgi:hypothetical protein
MVTKVQSLQINTKLAIVATFDSLDQRSSLVADVVRLQTLAIARSLTISAAI